MMTKHQLDDLGVAPTSVGAWANRKSRWRKRARRILKTFDAVAASHNKGIHVSMGTLYELARTIADVGERGVGLRVEMPGDVMRRAHAGRSLAAVCSQLESASKSLERIAVRQNTPLVDFPTFDNKLYVMADVDTGALEALEKMVEEERK
ncbi:MAG: hypothetical protein ACREYE_24535 [Gammaproteobacteria bacterium]